MRLGLLLMGTVLAIMTGAVALQPADATAQAPPAIDVPVTGHGQGIGFAAAGGPITFEGTFSVRRFAARTDTVWAVGTLSGTFYTDTGQPGGQLTQEPVRATVQRLEASCTAFRVVIGPVDVEIDPATDAYLQQVDLDELVIGVTADEDADPLRRRLLCGLADLLGDAVDLQGDTLPLPAADVARLLNQALRLVR